MSETGRGPSAVANDAERGKPPRIFNVHGVRYQVKDVARGGRLLHGPKRQQLTASPQREETSHFHSSSMQRQADERS